MSKKHHLKAEKAVRNEEYAKQFKKRKRSSVEIDWMKRPGYEVVCAACGVLTTVPFEPKNGKPVLCHACFVKARVAS